MSDNNINLDFSKKLIIETDKMEWIPSPLPGVDRRRLEREEAEAGRATSIVRYAPGSSFSSHTHGGGEEYIVLDGTFSDQSGDYGKGYYVRNPPGSSHAPHSEEGCVIFVKLCQMDEQGEPQVNLDTNSVSWKKNEINGDFNGHSQIQLFKNDREHVQLEKLEPGAELTLKTEGQRVEILILEGTAELDDKNLEKFSWIRLPKQSEAVMKTKDGCQFWSKHGSI
ncbi:cupin domain-containing protein [Hyphomicrobiales bacterium 4NK60-0047b]|jgi:mannose-6-phosphate isomerase-like protein (cupin superfamily)